MPIDRIRILTNCKSKARAKGSFRFTPLFPFSILRVVAGAYIYEGQRYQRVTDPDDCKPTCRTAGEVVGDKGCGGFDWIPAGQPHSGGPSSPPSHYATLRPCLMTWHGHAVGVLRLSGMGHSLGHAHINTAAGYV